MHEQNDPVLGRTRAAGDGQVEPSRLACFDIPGAINHDSWFPEDEGPKDSLAASHRPLTDHRDRFTVLTNLLHIQERNCGHGPPDNRLTGTNIKITPDSITNTIPMEQVATKHFGPTARSLRSRKAAVQSLGR